MNPVISAIWKIQTDSSRIWTRVVVSTSCDDNHYTTCTSLYMKVFSGQPTQAPPGIVIHLCSSLMSSSLLHQLCLACLDCFTRMVCEMEGKWPHSYCFVGFCLQYLFKTARSILALFPSSFSSMRLVRVQMVRPYSSIDSATTWKKSRFTLPTRSDFHTTENLSIAVHAFARRMLTSLSVDEMLLSRYVNRSTDFKGLPLKVEMAPFWLNIYDLCFICVRIETNVSCCLLYAIQLRFSLDKCICVKRLIICVVYVCSSFYWVPSASCLLLYETIFYIRSIDIKRKLRHTTNIFIYDYRSSDPSIEYICVRERGRQTKRESQRERER